MKLLKKLYRTHSPSGGERKLSRIVQKELKKIGIRDYHKCGNQIYRVNPDTPLLCAHLDHVGMLPTRHIVIDNKKGTITGNRNIGADDKNGVWIVLRLLRLFPNISFIFSTNEELMCIASINGYKNIEDILTTELMKDIRYGLVFDRRGKDDIIGGYNEYASDRFLDDVSKIGEEFGYSSGIGTFSDCDLLSDYISCVNISCGYYNAHTDKEYTIIKEIYNALEFGKEILANLIDKYEKPEKWNWEYERDGFQYYCTTHSIDYSEEGYLYNGSNICPICGMRKSYYGSCVSMKNEYSDEEYWNRYTIEDEEEEYENIRDCLYCENCYSFFDVKDIIEEGECPMCYRTLDVINY